MAFVGFLMLKIYGSEVTISRLKTSCIVFSLEHFREKSSRNLLMSLFLVFPEHPRITALGNKAEAIISGP